jgi:glycosyltransferase involved in cell wall biosynthesis
MSFSRGVTVVVPVYNSATSLEKLLARLDVVLKDLGFAREVILVNDGSRDGSWEKVQSLCRQYAFVQGINMMRNYGQHNALLCGIRLARYDLIVTIDDDLQHPPEEIPKLLAELEKGYDVVYGTPEAEHHGFLRDVASNVTKMALQNAMGADTARRVSAFRVFRTQLRDAFGTYQGSFVSIDVLLTWGSTRFSSAPVKHVERPYGASNYTLRKLIIHALNMMTGFSVLPLQLASLVGFAMTFLGLVVLGYVITRYAIHGGRVPGFSFLASLISIFSGAQMFAMGIMGEYLARMHFRSQERPTYAVREHVTAKANAEAPDTPVTLYNLAGPTSR